MKIKTKKLAYSEVLKLTPKKHKKPLKPMFILALVIRVLSFFELLGVGFKYKKTGMEKLSKKEPCLILMNHSSFIDLKIASALLFPRKYNIVMTSDGFVGKNLLMRLVGCIPTQKFIGDSLLVRDILHCVKKNNTSILMYPEASYSFDGTATPLPESLGKLVKKLGIPVVMIKTFGAFQYDPLYNNLQKRKVKISAEMKYLLSPEQIKEKAPNDINEILKAEFSFDNFVWQQENGVKITEKFRADCLNRVLYKCPNCLAEGETVGKGINLTCKKCGKVYELTEEGFMKAQSGETEFTHIPDWYKWQRECVKEEIQKGEYKLCEEVDIYMMIDTKCVYKVGDGVLTHTKDGFSLEGCNGELKYTQAAELSYSLYSDFYWYEIGDVISIGTPKVLYYCIPKTKRDIVAKARIAAEEIYKMIKK
ncbi:MAG: 1-acyl-sn-glycerol-3-phosphate acyltransferase [Ruminococcaceae bacterium]|nr:1-acyl-sn-glycerol-3-phosphate acyltransferase [Oscillospiraceae bacterium]